MEPILDKTKRVSLDEVARAVGVSKATVCRALLGRSRVSDATRIKVREAAERLGYRPDPALSALTRHRWASGEARRATYQVAIIRVVGPQAPQSTRSSINSNPSVAAARKRCEELGIMVSEWVLEEQHSPRHLGRMLYNRGVDGILFNIEGPVQQWDFPWEHFAVVTLGHDQYAHPTHSVVPNWFRSVTIAASKVVEAGYRRIGFANLNRHNPELDDLIGGAIARVREKLLVDFGPQPSVFTYPAGNAKINECYAEEGSRFLAWLKGERPDVVIDSNRVAYWWLKDQDIRMPAEIGYVTLLGEALSEEACLSSVSLHRIQQGRSAIELLFNLIQMNQRGLPDIPVRLIVAAGWVEGKTLRSRNPPLAPA